MVSTRGLCVLGISFLGCASMLMPALADDEVETVVVTSAKLPEPVGNTAFSVVALDQGQLSENDRLDAALEDSVPGLSLFRRSNSVSANPSIEGVSLRDIAPSAASRSLVLLDGVPLNDPFGGWVVWSGLPYEDIENAEIVRGAGAGPYGSGALTGTISLSERPNLEGVSEADVSGGSLGTYRAGASGGASLDDVNLFASAAGERSNGWVPVLPGQAGLADNHAWLDSGSASLRGQTQLGGVLASARLSYYDDAQGSGLVGADAKAHGLNGSLTLASGPQSLGWRVQGWFFNSGFSNTSVAVAPSRLTTTPADDQYATPALGLGLNAELLGDVGQFHWELGGDLRHDEGQSKELYQFSSGTFLSGRRAGGQSLVSGLYGEAAYDLGEWLLTAGVRADYWATAQGHLLQYALATGKPSLDVSYPGRDGVVPTARLGARRNFSDGEFLRASAYAGFREPTLNELYRPFRVGNDVTDANPDLSPEKLYGAEIGWGGASQWLNWDVTGYYNQIHDPVANVTIGKVFCGPMPCGILFRKENIGDLDALGAEGEATVSLTDALALRGAISFTDAQFEGNAQLLSNKRPAQAPRFVATSGVAWSPWPAWHFGADVRFVGDQFEDDLNTLKLGSALVTDVRAQWQFKENLSLIAEIDNIADATVNTGETSFEANGAPVISIGAPRTFQITLDYLE
jgi:vitamin B12 transporter